MHVYISVCIYIYIHIYHKVNKGKKYMCISTYITCLYLAIVPEILIQPLVVQESYSSTKTIVCDLSRWKGSSVFSRHDFKMMQRRKIKESGQAC